MLNLRSSSLPLAILAVWGLVVLTVSPVHGQDRLQSIGMLQVEDVSASVLDAARTSVAGPDRVGKDGPLAAVGMELAVLYHQYRAEGAQGVRQIREARARRPKAADERGRGERATRIHSPLSQDGQFVTVEAIAADGTARLLQELRRLGLENGAAAGNLVSGRLPVAAIREAAALPSLRGMLPSYAVTSAGSVGSEADTAHATDQVRRNTGLNGSGQKICALSDSYDQNSTARTSASEDVQSGDLPGTGNPEGNTTPVDVVQDLESGGSDEGRAMLQLIHDIAPGAALGYHTAFGGLSVFASGIRDLADANCTVIVDDIRYNTQPFYQDGPVSNAVDDVVNNDGVPFFSAAGNWGQESYEAPFRNSGQSGALNSDAVAHDFDPSDNVDTDQSITIEPGGSFRIFSFQWTDPFETEAGPGPDTDIDIALLDQNGNVEAESTFDNINNGVPLETLEYSNDTGGVVTLNFVIEKVAGPDPEQVKSIIDGSGFTIEEYNTLGPTVWGHPNAEGAMAVAAAPFYNTERYNDAADPAVLESFSSKGGIPIFFDQSGTPLLTPQDREKPEVTGTDGIDNTFFGSDLSDSFADGIDGDPHPNFFGTSAAAPNVAAIAGLIKQARPGLTPEQVYSRLEDTAEDVTRRVNRNGEFVTIASGRDPWSGHGFVQALDAVPDPIVSNLQATTSNPGSGSVQLSWSVKDDANIEEYELQRKYFDGPFETIARPAGPPVTIDRLGLGAFSFRVRWVRVANGDTTRGTSAPIVDTLDIRGLATEVVGQDEEGRRTVELSWSVPEGTENFTYRVERQRGDQGPFRSVGTTDQTSFQAERQVPGTYNYRVTSVDNQGNSLTSRPMRREIDFEEAAFAIGPYPNPVQNTASIDLTAQSTQGVTVEIYNTLGRRVYVDKRQVQALTPVTLTVDANRLSSGMYFLRVRGEAFSKTRKMIVVR